MSPATFTIDPALFERLNGLRQHPICQGYRGEPHKIAELCMLVGLLELECNEGDPAVRPRLLVHDGTWWLTLRLPTDDEGRAEALRTLVLDLLNSVEIAGPDGNGIVSGPLLSLLALCESKLKAFQATKAFTADAIGQDILAARAAGKAAAR